jgi:GNAT superfamily N-acetyltransferase
MYVECFYRDVKKSIASASLEGYPTVYGKKVSTHKVFTDAKHRNQGIASALFKYVEDVTGYKVEASRVKTPHGQALWHKYSQATGYYCLHDIAIGCTIFVKDNKTVQVKSNF